MSLQILFIFILIINWIYHKTIKIAPNYCSSGTTEYVKNTKTVLVQGVLEDPAGFEPGTFHSYLTFEPNI